MKVSIITVTWNAEKFLENCITSVLNQAYPDIEYIVIDGQSTDSTLSIINRYRNSIAGFVSEKDEGMYDALNKGIEMCSGDIVGILNADDFYADNSVIQQIVEAFKGSDADILYGDLDYVDPQNTEKVLRKWRTKPYFKGAFQWGWMPAHPTFYAKRELFKQFGKYKPQFGSASDYELMLRFIHKHQAKSILLPQVLVKMRNGGMSNSSLKNRINANRKDMLAMKENNMRFPIVAAIMKPLRKVPQFLGL